MAGLVSADSCVHPAYSLVRQLTRLSADIAGSILEFIPLLQHLSTTYTPDTLPIHAIVPSLIGYAFSGPSPTDRPFGNADQAILEDKLMRGLGFEGYVAQGGDIGGFISFKLGNLGKGCKGASYLVPIT
jgi:microsomal epoxide hydrolase